MTILEILKKLPIGIKLYSSCYGEVELIGFGKKVILCKDNQGINRTFMPNGSVSVDGECMLFPSKTCRKWKDLPFNKGDIVTFYNEAYDYWHIGMFDHYTDFKYCHLSALINAHNEFIIPDNDNDDDWNDGWNASDMRIAIKRDQDKFYDYMKNAGYTRWQDGVVWTFKKTSLKPYDKVLVKESKGGAWYPTLVSYVNSSGEVFIIDETNAMDYVIPYEGNEYLIGEYRDPKAEYITW